MDFFRLSKKDLITTQEWSINDINAVLEWTRYLKESYCKGERPKLLPDKTFLMLFYAISTRTRISFETAMTELEGIHKLRSKKRNSGLGDENRE